MRSKLIHRYKLGIFKCWYSALPNAQRFLKMGFVFVTLCWARLGIWEEEIAKFAPALLDIFQWISECLEYCKSQDLFQPCWVHLLTFRKSKFGNYYNFFILKGESVWPLTLGDDSKSIIVGGIYTVFMRDCVYTVDLWLYSLKILHCLMKLLFMQTGWGPKSPCFHIFQIMSLVFQVWCV